MTKRTLGSRLGILLAMTWISFSAHAGPACYIFISGSCTLHPNVPSNSWFSDNYNGSPTHPGVCLHRATEYFHWCGMPSGYVNAAFNLDVVTPGGIANVTVNAQRYPSNGASGAGAEASTYGLNWEPIVTDGL